MNTFSKIQERHIAANKYRLECANAADQMCECGQPSSEHRYGTSECMGCDHCKKFKREMKNADTTLTTRDACRECGGHEFKVGNPTAWPNTDLICVKCGWAAPAKWFSFSPTSKGIKNADGKIMVHCDACNKTFYESPDGDGLCPDCKKKNRENASAYIYVGDKVKLKSEPDTTWTVSDFAGDTYVLRGPKGSRQARLDQLERVSL